MTRAGPRHTSSQDTLIVHAALVAIVSVVHWAAQDPVVTLVVGGALSGLTYLGLAFAEARRAPLWLTPLSFYFLWYAVQLGPAAIYHGWLISSGGIVPFGIGPVDPEDLANGYVLFLVGSWCFHAGVQLIRPGFARAQAPEGTFYGLLVSIGVLWTIGIVAAWNINLFGFLGALRTFATGSSFAALCALVLIPRRHLRLSAGKFYLLVLIGTAGLGAANLNSGSKATLMFSFLPLAWHLATLPRLRWWLGPAAVALALVYFNIVLPVVTIARATAIQQGSVATSPALLVQALLDNTEHTVSEGAAFGTLSERAEGVLQRLFDPAATGFVAGQVRANGLLLGESMQYASYAFVPRILWPDKPTVTRGAWFAAYLGAAQSEETATVAIGISAIGELYWNFGVPGVVMGMLVYGGLVGGLWRLAGADPRYRPLHMLLYMNTVLAMTDMPEAVTIVGGAIAALIAFGVAFATLQSAGQVAGRVQRMAVAG